MREIKFRGKRVDNGEWVYGDLIHDCNRKLLINIAGYSHTGAGVQYQGLVIPETVGQFTELKDVSANSIYEDDIVTNGSCNYVIKYVNGAYWLWSIQAQIISLKLNEWFGDVKVIGNIHDNPELLTKK